MRQQVEIEYTLYGETVGIRLYNVPAEQRETIKARGYEHDGRAYTMTIVGRELGTAEAVWLRDTFPGVKPVRDISGGGVA